MTRSDRLTLAALAAASAIACTAPAPAPTPPPPTPQPMSAEQAADLYGKCWGYFNDKNWEAFQLCYTPDATSEGAVDSGQPPATGRTAIIEAKKAGLAPNPDARGDVQLLLANGNDLVSVALWKGTHSAPRPGPDGKEIPPSGKKFGFLMAHHAELDGGRTAVKADSDYVDFGTYLAQIGVSPAPARKAVDAAAAEPTVAIATGSADETGNVAAVQAMIESFNKRDSAGFEGMLADSYVLHEIGLPADQNKKQAIATMKELFRAFSDAKLTTTKVLAAGPYVVVLGTLEGTNDGAWPAMGIKKKTDKPVKLRFLEVFKLDGGKVVEDWLFYNGAAMAGQLGVV